MCRFLRTALPIGQGAFYFEKLEDRNGNLITVVYDCGSSSSHRILFSQIDDFFQKGDEIDILFISHFDLDHINGILHLNDRCNIKKIIMPLISPNMWYLYALSAINKDEYIIDFISFIEGNRDKIIEVKPYNIEGVQEGENYFLNDLSANVNQIESGSHINVSRCTDGVYWIYIPINFAHSDQELSKLKGNILSRLQKNGITDISQLNSDVVARFNKEIRLGFKDADLKLNENSLVVYSGPNKDMTQTDRYGHHICWSMGCRLIEAHYHRNIPDFYLNRWRDACLFTGDAKLDIDRCNSVVKIIKDLKSNIGTLQIPHHGSAHNFSGTDFENSFNLSLCNIFTFISHGIKNRYRHPSSKVITDLFLHHNMSWSVTEEKDSQFYEVIDI